MGFVTILSFIGAILYSLIITLCGFLLINNLEVRKYLNIQTIEEINGNPPEKAVHKVEKIIRSIGEIIVAISILGMISSIVGLFMFFNT